MHPVLLASMVGAVSNSVKLILLTGSPVKVFQSVIRSAAISVEALLAGRTRTNKCLQNKSMDVFVPTLWGIMFSRQAKGHRPITVLLPTGNGVRLARQGPWTGERGNYIALLVYPVARIFFKLPHS
jgi:hypothetical protein